MLQEVHSFLPLREFVHGQGVDHVLQMTVDVNLDGSTMGTLDAAYYYHQDERGSVRFVTDKGGDLVEEYVYEPYGAMVIFNHAVFPVTFATYADEGTPPASSIGNPYMFTGRRWDPESGLYYYRARMYEPHDAVFLQPDPIGTWGDVGNRGNAYAYVGNNPVMNTDPTGECAIFCTALIGAGIGCLASGAFEGFRNGWDGSRVGAACVGGAVTGALVGAGQFWALQAGAAAGSAGSGFLIGSLIGGSTGAVGGFLGDVTRQGIAISAGDQCSVDLKHAAEVGLVTGAMGAATGGFGGMLKGADTYAVRHGFVAAAPSYHRFGMIATGSDLVFGEAWQGSVLASYDTMWGTSDGGC